MSCVQTGGEAFCRAEGCSERARPHTGVRFGEIAAGRFLLDTERITYEKVPTEDNLPDILTKPVGGEYFESMAREICGAEALTLPGTNIDIRHKNRVIKAAKADRELKKKHPVS